jgi:hypothetical protein
MEPLDTDFDYVVPQQASVRRRPRAISARTRYNILLIFPALGLLWLLYLIGAAIFQWSVTGVVDTVMTLMIFLFLAAVAGLFWASAPRSDDQK